MLVVRASLCWLVMIVVVVLVEFVVLVVLAACVTCARFATSVCVAGCVLVCVCSIGSAC